MVPTQKNVPFCNRQSGERWHFWDEQTVMAKFRLRVTPWIGWCPVPTAWGLSQVYFDEMGSRSEVASLGDITNDTGRAISSLGKGR